MLFSKIKLTYLWLVVLLLIFSAFSTELKIADEENQNLQNVFPNESSVKLWKDEGNELIWEDSENLIPKELKEKIEFCVKEFPEDGQQRRTGLILSAQHEGQSSCLFVYIYDWICVLRLDLHFTVGLTVSRIWPFLRGIFRSIAESVDVDKRGDLGETPLMIASQIDAEEAVARLIERKSISVEANDKRGNGVLHLAVRAGSKSACEVLLRNNASVDALDWSFDRNTPLMIAAQKGDVEIVKLLLEFGADKNMKNSRQKTALQIARKFNHHSCAHLLQTHLR